MCPAQVELAALEEPEEQELVVELEEPEEPELVVEPAVVWAWRRLVEPAELVAQEGLDLMRAHFRMDRLVAMLARAVLEDSAARQARWAQMQRPFLVVLAELAATPGPLELVRRVPAALMGHLPHAMVASVAAAVLAERAATAALAEPEGQARLVVEPAVVWALLLAAALAVKAALAEMDLMQAL